MKPICIAITTIVLSCLCLSGCTDVNDVPASAPGADADLARPVVAINDKPEAYDDIYSVYTIDAQYALSLYEPKEGCYLGAYILSNKNVNFDIQTFEQVTKREHGIYVYNMKLGQPFPQQWVLECYARMKTPCIILEPDNDANPYSTQQLEACAKKFGELYIPMFVQFYPNPKKYGAPEDYVRFYNAARKIFKDNASNVSFVWAVPIDDVYTSAQYYPGDDNVDWVGLNIYKTIDNIQNMDAGLDYFYYTYQHRKPMMISQLAISHFTSSNHQYYTAEAQNDIDHFYTSIVNKYPRIKAVNYMDFNNLDISPDSAVCDNFSITDDESILDAYEQATVHPLFLNKLSIRDSGDVCPQMMRSTLLSYKKGNTFYIAEKTLQNDLGLHDLSALSDQLTTIDNENYYPHESLPAVGVTVSVDVVKKSVVLHLGSES